MSGNDDNEMPYEIVMASLGSGNNVIDKAKSLYRNLLLSKSVYDAFENKNLNFDKAENIINKKLKAFDYIQKSLWFPFQDVFKIGGKGIALFDATKLGQDLFKTW